MRIFSSPSLPEFPPILPLELPDSGGGSENANLRTRVSSVYEQVRVAALEVIALAIAMALWPVGWFNRGEFRRNSVEGPHPILLVHGYAHNCSAWVYIKEFLESEGLGPVYTVNLGGPFQTMEENAQVIADKAAEIRSETGVDTLQLVGHSMGGVASAYYAEEFAQEGQVTDVVTLGSPLRGTRVARIGVGECARFMRHESNEIQALYQRIMRENNPIRYFHVASRIDPIIRPTRSAVLEGNPVLELPQHGHLGMLYSERVARQVRLWLTEAT